MVTKLSSVTGTSPHRVWGSAWCDFDMVERFAFYDRAKLAYATVATGESAVYANVILKKGVIMNQN